MTGRVASLFDSFRYRDYRWLWIVVALSNTGQWAFTLGITAQVYALTGSSFWSGAVIFASMVPTLVGSPVVGVLADKMPRRRLIFMAIGLVLIVLVAMALATVGHVLSPAGMLLLALVFGFANSALSVSINTVVPTLVPKEFLYNAYSLQAVGQRGTEFVGPLLAAPLLAAFGPQAVYVFGAVLYAITILFVSILSLPNQVAAGPGRQGFLHSLGDGFSYIRSSPYIYRMIVLVGLHCALTMAFLGMLPGYVQHDLGSQQGFYGILMSMVGLGAIAGTLFLAGIKRFELRMGLFWVSAILSGVSLVLLGLSRNDTIAVIAILLVGASQALFMTLAIAFIQEATDEHVRGRVTSVYFVMAAGLMSLANWAYGALGTIVPPHDIMIVTGLLFTVFLGGYRLVTLRDQPRAVVPDENSSQSL